MQFFIFMIMVLGLGLGIVYAFDKGWITKETFTIQNIRMNFNQ